MVMGFINGLSNSSFRKILSELKPKSLEEAYSLIKNEQKDEVQPISSLNAINFTPKESHRSCSDKLQILLDKVDKLE